MTDIRHYCACCLIDSCVRLLTHVWLTMRMQCEHVSKTLSAYLATMQIEYISISSSSDRKRMRTQVQSASRAMSVLYCKHACPPDTSAPSYLYLHTLAPILSILLLCVPVCAVICAASYTYCYYPLLPLTTATAMKYFYNSNRCSNFQLFCTSDPTLHARTLPQSTFLRNAHAERSAERTVLPTTCSYACRSRQKPDFRLVFAL
jgi:hypothetical protein